MPSSLLRGALVVAALVLGLTGCGDDVVTTGASTTITPAHPSTVATSEPDAASDSSTAGVAPTRGESAPTSTFPTELVGTWIGGARGGGGSLTFTADGQFSTGKYQGIATVRGRTMTMQVDGQGPMVLSWSLDGGVLTLGNSSYLRDDRRPGASLSLVGYWINVNGWTSIRFGQDGSFELDDQANNDVTTGVYTIDGTRLTMSSRTKGTAVYLVRLADVLTFSSVDGRVLGEYTRAG